MKSLQGTRGAWAEKHLQVGSVHMSHGLLNQVLPKNKRQQTFWQHSQEDCTFLFWTFSFVGLQHEKLNILAESDFYDTMQPHSLVAEIAIEL